MPPAELEAAWGRASEDERAGLGAWSGSPTGGTTGTGRRAIARANLARGPENLKKPDIAGADLRADRHEEPTQVRPP